MRLAILRLPFFPPLRKRRGGEGERLPPAPTPPPTPPRKQGGAQARRSRHLTCSPCAKRSKRWSLC